MKKSLMLLLLTSSLGTADIYVNGYTKSNGTYVAPYRRTAPNDTTLDNYGPSKGNSLNIGGGNGIGGGSIFTPSVPAYQQLPGGNGGLRSPRPTFGN